MQYAGQAVVPFVSSTISCAVKRAGHVRIRFVRIVHELCSIDVSIKFDH